MATKKKTTKKRKAPAKKKTTKSAVTKWQKGVVHPVSKKPVGGRPMSQRDKKLFRTDGKRRAGTTKSKIDAAYGLKPKKRKAPAKKKAAPKRKTTAKRPAKKTTAKRPAKKTTKKRTAAKSSKRFGTVRYVSPSREKFKFVIYDGSGKDVYGTNSIRAARAKLKDLAAKHPRKKFTIYQISGKK
jgi:hypothetical protein